MGVVYRKLGDGRLGDSFPSKAGLQMSICADIEIAISKYLETVHIDIDQFLIPDNPCILSVSGGRTSAMMALLVWYAHRGIIPEDTKFVFCNTGREEPESLKFLYQLESILPIVWLEYDRDMTRKGGRSDPKILHKIVNYETASKNGEPFEKLIEQRGFLPSITRRFCTQELKIETLARYARRHLNWSRWHEIIGLRADESGRLKNKNPPPGKLGKIFPMAAAGIRKQDVLEFWSQMSFDLVNPIGGGNCDGCFLKGRRQLGVVFKAKPGVYDWWNRQEVETSKKLKRTTTFRSKYSIQEIMQEAHNPIYNISLWEDFAPDCGCTD